MRTTSSRVLAFQWATDRASRPRPPEKCRRISPWRSFLARSRLQSTPDCLRSVSLVDRGIGVDDDAVREHLRAGQLERQPAGIDALEEAQSAPQHDGEDREMKLVDQPVLNESAVEM